MNTSYDAFGVFSFSSGKIENNFGQQSQEPHGAIIFGRTIFTYLLFPTPRQRNQKR